ncbi:hypothetical protein [Natronobacterium texcoconense]|nr:hypothetical protein [Natronobacterium texcoconense]
MSVELPAGRANGFRLDAVAGVVSRQSVEKSTVASGDPGLS